MGLTVSAQKVFVIGDRKGLIVDVTFDSSYPTGGEALTAATLKLEGELNFVSDGIARKSDDSLAVMVSYDYTNKKLLAYKSNTAANPQPVADTASLDGYKVRLWVIGKGLASA